MESKPRKIAFVSGKGGVGKTLLAANFAFCSSTVQKTLLIDLDFQNQGASGLLAEHLKNNCLNAFDLLIASQKDQQAINIRNNLYFLPAFDPSKIDRFGSQDRAAFDAARIVDMNAIFNKLIAEGQYELVILDCHGGLDEVSFSSFICSDVTFVVTEADKVTFSGTLELLDFYINRAAALSRAPNEPLGMTSQAPAIITDRVTNIEVNDVRFLINRVSGQLSYDNLRSILAQQFYENIDSLQKMIKDFFFIPADPLAAESFSEYPFYLELMPESILSQKIELLFADALKLSPQISGRSIFYKIFERMRLKKLSKYLKSPYDVRVRAVFAFVAVTQGSFFIVALVLMALGYAVTGNPGGVRNTNLYSQIYLGVGMSGLLFLYLGLFNFRVDGFFRDRLRYEVRLYFRGVRPRSLAFLLRVIRLWLFRFVLWCGALFFLIVGGLFVISGIAAFIQAL